jgi:membrane-associated phospholipid phosphatase
LGQAGAGTAAPWRSAARLQPWLVTGGLLLLLAILTVNVLVHGPLVRLDEHIRATVQARALSPGWYWLRDGPRAPAQLVADLGRTPLAIPVLAVAAIVVSVARRSLRPLAAAAIGVTLLLATVIPAKILIGRPGPGLTSATQGELGVFPSGHTSTACVCYSLAVLLVVAGQPGWVRRPAVACLAVLWLLVGAALIWCDYHWFTDVAAAWALSALIVRFTLWVTGQGWRAAGASPP